ncbi:UNVERIFIED_CONTAM: hypothetical protein FKN15_042065 [Acipenser sinensis]
MQELFIFTSSTWPILCSCLPHSYSAGLFILQKVEEELDTAQHGQPDQEDASLQEA